MERKIEFDEVKHTYRLDGVVYPSVTQIMQPLSAEKYGSVPADILQAAADRGTMVHEAIENYIKYDFADYPEEISGYMDGFFEFWEKYHPESIESEMRLYHTKMMYAGTLDFLCKIDGKVYLIDFKTTSVLNHNLCRVQLEAYAKMLESHGIQVEGRKILQLKKDGGWKECDFANDDPYAWTVFCALMTIYNYTRL